MSAQRSLIASSARVLWAFAAAVLAIFVLSSLAQTTFVVIGLAGAGASFSPLVVMSMAVADLYGLVFLGLAPFPLLLAIGCAVAFAVAALVAKVSGGGRRWFYPLAGAAMMGALLGLTQAVIFGISLYAGTRGIPALVAQMAAGAVGGYLFFLILKEEQI